MEKGLIIQKVWLDKIFDEGKTWEMRSTKTKVAGKIGLIEAGSGLIVGEAVTFLIIPVKSAIGGAYPENTFPILKNTGHEIITQSGWVIGVGLKMNKSLA